MKLMKARLLLARGHQDVLNYHNYGSLVDLVFSFYLIVNDFRGN